MDLIKHFLYLLPRLLLEYFVDFLILAFRFEDNYDVLSLESESGTVYYTRYGNTNATLQGYFLHIKTYPTNENLQGLKFLINNGNPVRVVVNGYEHNEVNAFETNDKLDLVGAALVASKKGTLTNFPDFALDLERAIEKIDTGELHLYTNEALVRMAFFKTCGQGMLRPQLLFQKLLKLYTINLLLKPITTDPRAIIALKILSENTDSRLLKALYILNNIITPFNKLLKYIQC